MWFRLPFIFQIFFPLRLLDLKVISPKNYRKVHTLPTKRYQIYSLSIVLYDRSGINIARVYRSVLQRQLQSDWIYLWAKQTCRICSIECWCQYQEEEGWEIFRSICYGFWKCPYSTLAYSWPYRFQWNCACFLYTWTLSLIYTRHTSKQFSIRWCLIGLVLWHINHCCLFNAKSCSCVHKVNMIWKQIHSQTVSFLTIQFNEVFA